MNWQIPSPTNVKFLYKHYRAFWIYPMNIMWQCKKWAFHWKKIGRRRRMAKVINNMDELEVALQPIMIGMVDKMAERVYQTLNFFLQFYYNSYNPVSYRRQYDFLRSAFKVDARIVRGKVIAAVYIDEDYMSDYYNASGRQVATWANEGLHGGLNVGGNTPHVWDNTMDTTVNNGELLKLAVDYLKSKGISVQV